MEPDAQFVVGVVAEPASDALDLLDDSAPALGSGVGDVTFEEPLDLRSPAPAVVRQNNNRSDDNRMKTSSLNLSVPDLKVRSIMNLALRTLSHLEFSG